MKMLLSMLLTVQRGYFGHLLHWPNSGVIILFLLVKTYASIFIVPLFSDTVDILHIEQLVSISSRIYLESMGMIT